MHSRRSLASLRSLPWPLLAALVLSAACGDDDPTGGGGSGGSGGDGAGGQVTGGGGEGATGGVGGAGGEGGQLLAPPLTNPVDDMSDIDLAYASLWLMGYELLDPPAQTCTQCHSLNRGLMNHWRDLTDTARQSCFADTSVPSEGAAQTVLQCLKLEPGIPGSPYTTSKLGIYAAAAHLDWFSFVFDRAYEGDGSTEHADFEAMVGMPKEQQTPFVQEELDIVAEWFTRGLPFMEDLLPEEPPVDPCVTTITAAVATHINEMKVSGWRAVNSEGGLLMLGCAGAPTTLDCLATYPQAGTQPYGAGWEYMQNAKLRVLRTNSYASSYWTRSSADGRFVGHGGGSVGGSTIVDLATDVEIGVSAAYDPGFFPDNSAFIFQGTNDGTGICMQSLLNSDPSLVSFNEPECSSASQIGLYQHVGAALGGGDYWAVDGMFVSDDGGHFATLDNPQAFFAQNTQISLTPMINDGSGFTPKTALYVDAPFEGDTVMSPSSELLISRVAGQGWVQNGFRMRQLIATPSGNTYTVDTPEIGRYCIDGGKPGFSYDERWAVLHRYVTGADAIELGFTGPNDPAFAEYASEGAANIYLLDLLTGQVTRVTHMQPGQYALFPHFRSDGWFYFMVRSPGTGQEHIVASDAALIAENL
jgi:hypothetical protein